MKDTTCVGMYVQKYMYMHESIGRLIPKLRFCFCLILLFTSHQQYFSYVGMGLPG